MYDSISRDASCDRAKYVEFNSSTSERAGNGSTVHGAIVDVGGTAHPTVDAPDERSPTAGGVNADGEHTPRDPPGAADGTTGGVDTIGAAETRKAGDADDASASRPRDTRAVAPVGAGTLATILRGTRGTAAAALDGGDIVAAEDSSAKPDDRRSGGRDGDDGSEDERRRSDAREVDPTTEGRGGNVTGDAGDDGDMKFGDATRDEYGDTLPCLSMRSRGPSGTLHMLG